MDTGTKRFADGFFSGKASCQSSSLATALPYLHIGIDAFEETFAMTLIDFAYAPDLDDVDTNSHVHALWQAERRG